MFWKKKVVGDTGFEPVISVVSKKHEKRGKGKKEGVTSGKL